MTVPLTDQQLRDRIAEIRAQFQADAAGMPSWLVNGAPVGLLLAEIDRLRAELDKTGAERETYRDAWHSAKDRARKHRHESDLIHGEAERLRAESDYWRHRYYDESRTCWDAGLPPGGECCADCGQPVESEPCPDHHPATVAERLRAELAAASCACYPDPADHETDCPRAAAPSA